MGGAAINDHWTRSPARLLASLAVLGFASFGLLLGTGEDRTRSESASSGRSAVAHHAEATRLIDVNAASEAELSLLPRIGPTRAAAIVQERERNGAFGSVDDLRRVRGIGPRTVEALRGFARAGHR